MARLPQNHIAADIIIFGIIYGDFLFYIDNGMLCVLMRIASNDPSCTYFHDSKGIQAIEVLLYLPT